jgi:bla regulator protein blaR1
MMLYFIKVILCSALLLLVYFLFLEKEKMHRFNRFYLLFSIVAAFIIPLITLPVQADIFPASATIATTNIIFFDEPDVVDNTPTIATSDTVKCYDLWSVLVTTLYLAVSSILLFRFLRNLLTIIASIRQNKKVNHPGAKLVLTNSQQVPYTFLHYIFLHKNDYENSLIKKEMLCHEMVHVQQQHSLDILFIEILMVIFWFNPLLYFYRKAIRLNHEFLADDVVVETFQNPIGYQQLLLQSASRSGNLLPTSLFHYSITKKRLLMITKNTSPKMAFAKQVAVLPFAVAIILLFSTKVVAQQSTEKRSTTQDTIAVKEKVQPLKTVDSVNRFWNKFTVGYTVEGVTPELLTEYETIIKKYETEDKWWHTFSKRVSEQDKNRMEDIFKQMNLEQQSKQFLVFMKPSNPLPRTVPTKNQLDLWKNSNIYGVWINNKRVANTLLTKYVNTDFAQVYVSKLTTSAINYGKHYYQVDLMTKDYYQNYYNQTIANTHSHIGFAMNNHPVDSLRNKFRVRKTSLLEKQKSQDNMYRNAVLLEMIPVGPGVHDNEMDQYLYSLNRLNSIRLTKTTETNDLVEVFLSRLARIYFRMKASEKV